MAKNHKKNQKKNKGKIGKPNMFALPEETKKWIWGVLILILAAIVALSFFDLAGVAGKTIMEGLTFLIGKAVFIIPLIFVLGGLVFFKTRYDKFLGPAILGILILIIGVAGILEILDRGEKNGGLIGYIFSFPFLKLFGVLVSEIIFGAIILIGGLVFWHLISGPKIKKAEKGERSEKIVSSKEEKRPSLIEKIFAPQFKIKEVEPKIRETSSKLEESILELKEKPISQPIKAISGAYQFPPIELLEADKGKPTAGDTITNSAIIKKTLENFGLGVEMSEINIGPTVTQYALKPADGIKLSKITGLNNNLSLALASHPIRIEAPIPGKPLVGIEVPNKERCKVRLRELISNPVFQNSASTLTIVLGRDVSGAPCYADLARMPHLLVAGSTGTGKTIFLNSLIASLLYQNSPAILRFILIDPKRVEFSAYHELPHLLTPVIFDAQRSVNSLKWLTSEMERRFDVLSGNGSRDINSYNAKVSKEGGETLPYIVLIVDELADLMAAKGREMEAGVVRLAQMSRAVGIHLVLATQRPSVEVITGLIKANVTSRVTFQVASQVDSRTVLDMAGAEKLLGLGDMLFVSAEVAKPKRVQGAYVSEKEIRKVVDYIKSENPAPQIEEGILENHLAEELEKTLENESPGFEDFLAGEDLLYEEAKRTVLEAKKASASYLQRRLRIGYARAARLLDMLEEQGIVGPADGAKPREVYFKTDTNNPGNNGEKDEWQKV
ncbi:MAG: hypothetical protein A2175_00175 [Candidatus Nealsonbacteria bacterium RBG_13_42_11]|uniref:FtsK domain-containing protein n=1 Tax=Candidatus Nealsonbacteria bacterium RBG_13_42_11 TaxID=1801663 RepID=A0A1G2DYL0_9BACT|nr:MAG: hypothetical protein A2175_00175 [Candidatus Nealsonbacteria bacterium RBG_13_42_11]